ncbi:MAG: glycosyltransferase family 2 protein [Candidatus Aminicenantes bacterium]|nr:glycosyltransferase family 2 protein [Candidatus Aminicenantes bacterium]
MSAPSRSGRKPQPRDCISPEPVIPGPTVPLTVIIPAFNEAPAIADTLRSLLAQTRTPASVIVVDDCSTDGTGDAARAFGVTVVRPPANTGSKAGAQTFALPMVRTPYAIALDADTTLAPDAIERLLPAFEDPRVAAACGSVLPRRVRSVWERGRYIEYLFAFTFYKRVQDQYGTPLISSGCFSMYRTEALREIGGWRNRTLAEDVDLTWTMYQNGYAVRFIPDAVAFPIEPHDFGFLKKQLRRWSHGFVQNVRLHRRGLLKIPFLRSAVAVALWDAIVASLVYLLLLPAIAILLRSPLILLGYVIDVPAVVVPVVVGAWPRREVGRALLSVPCFFILRTVNAIYFLEALWSEVVRGRSFLIYEKGH